MERTYRFTTALTDRLLLEQKRHSEGCVLVGSCLVTVAGQKAALPRAWGTRPDSLVA